MLNVDELLQVNGYHGGTVRVRDRKIVANHVKELRRENEMLKRQLLRQLLTLQAQRERYLKGARPRRGYGSIA